jgi:Uma2 family endonuclease
MVRVALPENVIRPLRRSEYERLVEAGAFDGERVELLYGRLVFMSPQGEPHASTIQRLNRLLTPRLLDRADVRIQSPIIAPDESRPEPDIAIVPLVEHRKESPREAFLVIEVAQSSLALDRDAKLRLYALMDVPEYWVVNLEDNVVEVYVDPKDGEYMHSDRKGPDAALTPRAFPDVRLLGRDFLPL